jgi:hypothetical protein
MRLKLSTLRLEHGVAALLLLSAACLAAQSPATQTPAAQEPAAPAHSAPAWRPFGSSTEGFRALFPAEPEETKSTVPVGGDSYELRSYVTEQGTTALYVGVCDYGPKGATADPHELLTSAKAGAMGHMSAHILSEKKIDLGTGSVLQGQGVSFEAENEKLHFSVRMYIADGILYQIMAATPLGETFADTARFLDSFELLKPAAKTASVVPTSVAEWKPYRSTPDRFSATFPSVPTVEKQNITTDAGQFELRTYVSEDGQVALIIAVCDYGASAKDKDPEQLLDHAKTGALNNLKARLLSEKQANLGSDRGAQFEAENSTHHISARLFLAGPVLYQTMVVSPLSSHYAATGRFLDSFQLGDQ